MKKIFCSAFLLLACQAQASGMNLYDQVFLDCTDYGHPPVSQQEIAECKELAQTTVLAVRGAKEQFELCLNEQQSPVSEEVKEQCLREISKL